MKTEILPIGERGLSLAKKIISDGGVVAFHTETVYGLGADARSDDAVAKIFALKGRPADNPLIVHVHSGYDISALIDGEPPYAAALRGAFLPGPLTMVYPSENRVSRLVSCGLNTLAVRVPSSMAAQAFLKAVDVPIAAPSANRSKHVSPVTALHVKADLDGKIPLILDGGPSAGGIESTVLDCTGKIPQVLRAGLITREEIARIVGACGVYEPKAGERPKSPGMAYKHYMPNCETALYFEDELESALSLYDSYTNSGRRVAILGEHGIEVGERTFLDLGATPEEMAARLYKCIREGEAYDLLIAVAPSARGGVMEGVMNRFLRAFGGTI